MIFQLFAADKKSEIFMPYNHIMSDWMMLKFIIHFASKCMPLKTSGILLMNK